MNQTDNKTDKIKEKYDQFLIELAKLQKEQEEILKEYKMYLEKFRLIKIAHNHD